MFFSDYKHFGNTQKDLKINDIYKNTFKVA